jgi:GTP pyrophosphokinase
VQIRTREMHHVAEYGIAAHWKYKSGEKASADIDKKLDWISKLIDTENEASDPDEFLHAFKIDIFHDETFVFTPKGDVIALPQGATLIDFAYSIHTGVGNKMVGAKINGRIAPIDSAPKNGDIVEVITSNSSKGPSRDWLNIVKTSEARNKIKQWFKKEKRQENIVVGKIEVDKILSRRRIVCTETERDEIVGNVAKRLGMMDSNDLYNGLGYGGISLTKVELKLLDEYERNFKKEPVKEITVIEPTPHNPNRKRKSTGGVIVDGEDGCAVKFAKCCNPLPGDAIIGFITRGFGVSIHKLDCQNVAESRKNEENLARWVNAAWEKEDFNSNENYEAAIQLITEDGIGIIASISMALADMRVSISSINTQTLKNGTVAINISIGCRNTSHFESIVSRLRSIKSVINVTRGFAN